MPATCLSACLSACLVPSWNLSTPWEEDNNKQQKNIHSNAHLPDLNPEDISVVSSPSSNTCRTTKEGKKRVAEKKEQKVHSPFVLLYVCERVGVRVRVRVRVRERERVCMYASNRKERVEGTKQLQASALTTLSALDRFFLRCSSLAVMSF